MGQTAYLELLKTILNKVVSLVDPVSLNKKTTNPAAFSVEQVSLETIKMKTNQILILGPQDLNNKLRKYSQNKAYLVVQVCLAI